MVVTIMVAGIRIANAKSPAPNACISVERPSDTVIATANHSAPNTINAPRLRQQLTMLKNIALTGGTSCHAARIGENQKIIATGM
jgi:hypothetical protein